MKRNWRAYVAIFMIIAVFFVSGVIATNSSFFAEDENLVETESVIPTGDVDLAEDEDLDASNKLENTDEEGNPIIDVENTETSEDLEEEDEIDILEDESEDLDIKSAQDPTDPVQKYMAGEKRMTISIRLDGRKAPFSGESNFYNPSNYTKPLGYAVPITNPEEIFVKPLDNLGDTDDSTVRSYLKDTYCKSIKDGLDGKSISLGVNANFVFDATKHDVEFTLLSKRSDDGWHIDGVVKGLLSTKVSYNPNFPSGSNGEGSIGNDIIMTDTIINNTNTIDIHVASQGEIKCTGYRFLGWSDSDKGNVKYQPGDVVPESIHTKEVTFYAIWQETGSAMLNYATGLPVGVDVSEMPVDEVSKEADVVAGAKAEFTVSDKRPTAEGYEFDGWVDELGNPLKAGAKKEVALKETAVLTAKWIELKKAILRYDNNFSSVTDVDVSEKTGSVPATQGEDKYLSIDTTSVNYPVSDKGDLNITGYNFTGWNTKADGSGTFYPADGSVDITVNAGDDITLYAQWEIIPADVEPTYTITVNYWIFDPNVYTEESEPFTKLDDHTVIDVKLLENGKVDPDEDGFAPIVKKDLLTGKDVLEGAIVSPKVEGYIPVHSTVTKVGYVGDKADADEFMEYDSNWHPTLEDYSKLTESWDKEKLMYVFKEEPVVKQFAVIGVGYTPEHNHILNIYYMPYAVDAGTPEGDTPGGDTPGGDTPGGDTPGGDTPGGDTPGGDTPEGDVPGGDTPEGDTPGGDTPEGDVPGGDTPEGDVPGGDTPEGEGTPDTIVPVPGIVPAPVPVATPTPVVTPAPVAVPLDNIVPAQIQDNGNGQVSLERIDDIETALANMDLGHIDNILYFLILFATTIAFYLYCRSSRKHQERIFELRSELGEDDPYRKENKN